jgi:hypothetical protein
MKKTTILKQVKPSKLDRKVFNIVNELLVPKMTLTLNCKDAGDPVCTHTMYGEVHGYTEQSWNEEVAKNGEHFRKLIKKN